MTLRDPNNPNTSQAIMLMLKNILPVGTQLAASSPSGNGQELIYIQQKYKMVLGMSTIPIAVNLFSSGQNRTRESFRAYGGTTVINVCYYMRIDSQDTDFDALWETMDQDIERMAANLESKDTTEYGGFDHTLSLERLTLSGYEPAFDTSIPNYTLLTREMALNYTLLPYSI